MSKILDKIKPPDIKPYKSTLLYGEPGSGKTFFLGTCGLDERTSPLLILDLDEGLNTVSGAENIFSLKIETIQDLNEIFSELSTGKLPYKAVAIDDLSELHFLCIAELTGKRKKDIKDIFSSEQAQIQEYGLSLNMMRNILKYFRELELHTFFLAKSKTEVDSRGKYKLPNLFGQLAEEVTGMFDACLYMAVETKQEKDKDGRLLDSKRVLILKNNPSFVTKIRTSWNNPQVPDMITGISYNTPILTEFFNLWGVK